MEHIPLTMILDDIDAIQEYVLPENYRSRLFKRGDDIIWAEIEKEAGEFTTVQSGLEQFQKEFGPFIEKFEKTFNIPITCTIIHVTRSVLV